MNKKILMTVILTVSALVIGGGYLLYQRYYGGAARLDIETTPQITYEYRKTASDHGIVSDYLWMRTKELMLGKDGDSLFIPSSYMIAGRLSYQDPESSGEYRLSDQALLLEMYVRRGDRISAMRLKEAILEGFDLESETNGELSEFLDAYITYYVSYGNVHDMENIEQIAGMLFDEEGNMRQESLSVASYEQGAFYSTEEAGDGSYSSLEQGTNQQDIEFAEVTGIRISSVDLRLIRNLENNGILPEGSYERNLELVLGAKVSYDIPLYAYAYSDGIYIYSHDVPAAIDVSEAVITMRHLSEVGELPEDSLSWLKMQIVNNGYVGREYYYTYGSTQGAQATDVYPDIMFIGIETGDDDLYELMSSIEGSRVATYSSSPALSMIFREENGRFVFYARENLLVCLAVT